MDNRINLKAWSYAKNDKIKLDYEDGDSIYVRKEDFNRAFGAIVSAGKADIQRDYAVPPPLDTVLEQAQEQAQKQLEQTSMENPSHHAHSDDADMANAISETK